MYIYIYMHIYIYIDIYLQREREREREGELNRKRHDRGVPEMERAVGFDSTQNSWEWPGTQSSLLAQASFNLSDLRLSFAF